MRLLQSLRTLKNVSRLKLNNVMQEILKRFPPVVKGKNPAQNMLLNYLPPSCLCIFGKHPYIKQNYRNYLENQVREAFDFKGAPIQIYFREKWVSSYYEVHFTPFYPDNLFKLLPTILKAQCETLSIPYNSYVQANGQFIYQGPQIFGLGWSKSSAMATWHKLRLLKQNTLILVQDMVQTTKKICCIWTLVLILLISMIPVWFWSGWCSRKIIQSRNSNWSTWIPSHKCLCPFSICPQYRTFDIYLCWKYRSKCLVYLKFLWRWRVSWRP